MEKYKPIKSLLKGLKILEAFTSQKQALSFQELTLKTGMPKATVFRFLHTLASQNYLSFDSKSKKYFIGHRVMSLGFAVLSNLELRDLARPYLEDLSSISKQHINLGILDGTEVVFIERISKWDLVNINLCVGSRVPSYQTSTGRAILAFLDRERFQSVLNELLKDTEALKHIGSGGKKLIMMLEQVRRRRYALNDEELVKGVRAIAAPIFNAQGQVEGAVNMPVFSYNISRKELIKRYLPMLLDTAERISAARGFVKCETKI
jgi:IclR family pca regulon transcriptional regulator